MAKITNQEITLITKQNPAIKELVRTINETNQLIEKISRSSYFYGVAIPNYLDKNEIVNQAINLDYNGTVSQIQELNASIKSLWNIRKDKDALPQFEAVYNVDGNLYPTYKPFLSGIKKAVQQRAKAERLAVKEEKDYIMLSRMFKDKSRDTIMEFISQWYKNLDIIGNYTITGFVKGVYREDFKGQDPQSWGSPEVKRPLGEVVIDTIDKQNSYLSELSIIRNIEASMDDKLYDAWMELFSL